MGIFGDLDVEAAADDPFAIEDGTYNATITECSVKDNKDKTKKGLTFKYQITDDGKMHGRKAQEWKNIPSSDDPQDVKDRDASYLKQRLLSIGIPADRINTFEPEDALGTDVVITVKNKDGFANVNRVILPESDSSDAGTSFADL